MTRPLFLHLGCSKSGTSSLQAGLWESVGALADAGVGVPFKDRQEHLDHLVRPLGWVPVEAFSGPHDDDALARAVDLIRETPGTALLVSNEDLAEVDRTAVEAIARVASRADVELHLILTVRGWGLQLPSEYQQFLKHRMTLSWADFLDAVRDREGVWADRYWQRQDAVGILARFEGLVPPESIHVVPITSDDPEAIFRATGEIVGVDPSLITRPGKAVNTSFGAVEAEVFRRVTLALGDRLPAYRDFAQAVRRPFVRGVLPHGASDRLRVPPEHLSWVTEYADSAVAQLTGAGYRLHGDLGSLRPTPGQSGPLPVVPESEVARVAVETLARYAVYQRERRPASAPTPRSRWWRR